MGECCFIVTVWISGRRAHGWVDAALFPSIWLKWPVLMTIQLCKSAVWSQRLLGNDHCMAFDSHGQKWANSRQHENPKGPTCPQVATKVTVLDHYYGLYLTLLSLCCSNELELYRYDVSVLCAPYRDAGNGPVGLMRYPDGQLYEGKWSEQQ